ncbi:SDR family NAD(P)-dependent oxidoreductase [Rhodococcus sp. TAF43]|uniref:SDR family NAD(P)-dependent oxidoreductase n=1 Tax=unclassified Rhodococcus (in: high G+C Gram-positive bacteria) TaxID=192944 RepID=UPI00158382B1|nr:SDR family NAD(P)-dependent oxidoreductase [Rhodococcus sp. W8901]QKT11154.1 SDR family NAD(P)-dependent oxidoreductase [Rhodococcus sp. W8901]
MRRTDITGRVVVVTGGARGIGRATATALRDAGALVAIGDIDEAEVRRTADAVGVFGAVLDVTDPRSVESFLARVRSTLGPPWGWINNAGVMPLGPLLEQDDAIVDTVVDVNLRGVVHGTRAAGRAMRASGGGRIVNIASIAGCIPAPGMAVYNATKAAVLCFGDAADAELAAHGVRVGTVLPTFTSTGLLAGTHPGRLIAPIRPEQVAQAVVQILRTGRRRAVVPGRLSGALLWPLFPRPVARLLRRATGLERVFLDVDAGRAEYDAGIKR